MNGDIEDIDGLLYHELRFLNRSLRYLYNGEFLGETIILHQIGTAVNWSSNTGITNFELLLNEVEK